MAGVLPHARRLGLIEEAFRTLPERYLGAPEGFDAIYLERPLGPGGLYPRLAELGAPAWFVWGARHRIIPPGFQRHVAKWLPGAEQMLENCGHVPQVERPEQTIGLLERFFARVDALGQRRANARAA